MLLKLWAFFPSPGSAGLTSCCRPLRLPPIEQVLFAGPVSVHAAASLSTRGQCIHTFASACFRATLFPEKSCQPIAESKSQGERRECVCVRGAARQKHLQEERVLEKRLNEIYICLRSASRLWGLGGKLCCVGLVRFGCKGVHGVAAPISSAWLCSMAMQSNPRC